MLRNAEQLHWGLEKQLEQTRHAQLFHNLNNIKNVTLKTNENNPHYTTYAKVCLPKQHASACNSLTQFYAIDLQAVDLEKKACSPLRTKRNTKQLSDSINPLPRSLAAMKASTSGLEGWCIYSFRLFFNWLVFSSHSASYRFSTSERRPNGTTLVQRQTLQ